MEIPSRKECAAHTSGLRTDSDNNTDPSALNVTLPLFEMCLPRLAVGGCLLLFQSGGKPDRPEILTEAVLALDVPLSQQALAPRRRFAPVGTLSGAFLQPSRLAPASKSTPSRCRSSYLG